MILLKLKLEYAGVNILTELSLYGAKCFCQDSTVMTLSFQ
jgi:hypothetical protein